MSDADTHAATEARGAHLSKAATRMRIVGGTVVLYGLSLVAAYALNFLVARWVGPEEFGRYIIVWNLISWAMTPASLGTSSAAMRYIPQFEYTDNRQLLSGFLIFSIVATTITSAGIGTLGIFASAWGVFPVLGTLGTMLVPFLVLTVVGSLGNLATEIARAAHNPWMAIAPQSVIRPLLALAGLILLGGALTSGTTASGVVASIAAAGSVGLVVQAVYVWRRFKTHLWRSARFDVRNWLATSASLCLFSVVVNSLMQLDTLMVGVLRGAGPAGIFGIDYRIYLVMEIPIVIANMLALPVLSGMFAHRDLGGMQAKMSRVSRAVFWSSAALAAVIVAASAPLLSLFGHDYESGRTALLWLAGAALTSALFGPVSFLAAVIDLQKIGLVILGLAAVIDVVGNLVLVPTWGVTGGAVAYFGGNLFRAVAFYVVIRRYRGLRSAAFF